MPTYEYACKDCENQFEIFQGFDEDTLTVCPSCQGRLRKKFSSVGVVFKGSGFYRTDSRSSSSSSTPAKAGVTSGSSEASSSASSSAGASTSSTSSSTAGSGSSAGSKAASA